MATTPDLVRAHGPGELVRARLDLAYDGTDFAGWAAQPGQRTVAGELAAALAVLLRLPDTDLAPVVAGRTDAGVHARGQVCHLDIPLAAWTALPGRTALTPGESLVRRLAGVLPPDVVVSRAELAPPGFDARFSALNRRYSYRLTDAGYRPPPLRRHDVVSLGRGSSPAPSSGSGSAVLDVPAMDHASRSLVGLHDFAAFCRRREGATTVRTLLEYSWARELSAEGDPLVVARVVADAFCHSMVRALVGGALAVGQGRGDAQWLVGVLRGRVRDPRVVVAPAHGLVLEEVAYPADDQLAARAATARAVRSL